MSTNILWCGGEDIDFPGFAGVINTTSGNFRSGFARCAIIGNGSFFKSLAFPGGAVTSCWLSTQLRVLAADVARLFLGLTNTSSASSGLYLGSDTSNGSKIALSTWNGTTRNQLAVESGTSISSTNTYKLDMQVINYGATATVNVYVNSILVITFTGNVTISGLTNLNAVCIGKALSNQHLISEIIVADNDSTTLSLVTQAPNAAGDTSEWTGAYTDINEITNNDSTVISTDTASQNRQVNLINTPTGQFACLMTKIATRAVKSSDASIATLKQGIKSGGTLDVDAGVALTTSWTTYERYMAVNPVTSNPFTIAELDALQAAFQSAT